MYNKYTEFDFCTEYSHFDFCTECIINIQNLIFVQNTVVSDVCTEEYCDFCNCITDQAISVPPTHTIY